MNHANTATYDAVRPASTFSSMAAQAVVRLPKPSGIRTYSLPETCRPAPLAFQPLAGRQVHEEGEYYIPDRLTDDDNVDPALTEAARAYTAKARDAMGQLDDAINLAGVLLDALEQDADVRAAQSRTVLEMALECIYKAHTCIDGQESQDQNLFLAHFEEQWEEEGDETGPPPMDR